VVQVSWPAYTYRRAASANVTGANPFNQDLWFHSAAVGHEFRFYNDNSAQWAHILDIAAFTHEAGMSRYPPPPPHTEPTSFSMVIGTGSTIFATRQALITNKVLMVSSRLYKQLPLVTCLLSHLPSHHRPTSTHH
jgi:hypothetical protein